MDTSGEAHCVAARPAHSHSVGLLNTGHAASETEQLKSQCSFILNNVSLNLKPILGLVPGRIFSVFRTTWAWESTFSILNLMRPK